MAVSPLSSPYDDQEIEEINLARAPLARVLTQVRHPALSALVGSAGTDVAMRLAERLVKQYPVFETTEESAFMVSNKGIEPAKGSSTIWRFRSVDEVWQVSINREFVSLETVDYRGRIDFCQRFGHLLDIYSAEMELPSSNRIGIRYTNRIDDTGTLSILPRLVRSELLGPAATEEALPSDVELFSSFSQARYNRDAEVLVVNWGLLPSNAVIDVTLPSVPRRSWLLDIDASTTERTPFRSADIVTIVESLAAQAYRCFRWAVTEDFIACFRGVK